MSALFRGGAPLFFGGTPAMGTCADCCGGCGSCAGASCAECSGTTPDTRTITFPASTALCTSVCQNVGVGTTWQITGGSLAGLSFALAQTADPCVWEFEQTSGFSVTAASYPTDPCGGTPDTQTSLKFRLTQVASNVVQIEVFFSTTALTDQLLLSATVTDAAAACCGSFTIDFPDANCTGATWLIVGPDPMEVVPC